MINKFKSIVGSNSLLSRSIRAGSILTIGSIADNALRFLRNIILARLLAPEDFGLMAMVIASVFVLEAFSEVGLRQSVIQNKNGAENSFINIIWWVSSFRGMILYGIAFLAAPFICDFYNKPQALDLLRIAFLVVLINGLMSPRVHVLEKDLKFKRWVVIMQGSGIISTLVGIGAAFFLHNVWALLIAYVTEAVLRLQLSFIFCPFLPRLKFNPEYTRDILNFSKKMFGLPILMILFVQTDVFVIGKVLSVGLLGMYSLARGLAEIPAMLAVKIIHPIALPALSTMQDEKVRLNNTFLSIARTIATFGIPLFSFFILFSGQILSIAYGTAYRIVAIPFGILCMFSFFAICSSLIMLVYISIGRPDIHRTASLIRTVLFLIIIYPATVSFGLVGSAASLLLSAILLLTAQMFYLHRILNIHVTEYFQTWIVGIKLSIIVIIPGILLQMVDYSHTVFSVVIGISCCLVAWGLGAISVGRRHSHSSGTGPIS